MNTLNINQLVFAWLNAQKGVSNKTIEKLLEYFKSPQGIWDSINEEKNNLGFIKPEIVNQLVAAKKDIKEKLLEKINKENVSITTILDDNYPRKLLNIINPPSILYCKGDIDCLNNLSIAIVGSRKATDYGIWCADKFSKELSNLGVTIISGLAYGIDAVAHKAALKNNGITIGVIGCGINVVYPPKNKELYKQIEENKGAVITEYAFDCEPIAGNFPNRNRIISGLSSGILVIEAQDKSGTLITASHAADQGREVFAVPGNISSIFSVGTNKLIRDGAKIVMSIDDIIDEIIELQAYKNNNEIKQIDYSCLNEIEIGIIKLVSAKEINFDEISKNLNYPIGEILSNLTLLEMKGLIVQTNTSKFMLAN